MRPRSHCKLRASSSTAAAALHLPPTSACRPALLSLLLAALSAAGGAFAQAGKPSPQAECTATNREKHAEVLAELDAARKRNVTNPVLVSRLQTFELQQGRLREALRRNARSEAECEQIGNQIEAEAERLAKLLGNEAAPAPAAAAAASAPAPAARALPVSPPSSPPPPAPPPPDLTCLNGVAQDFNGVVQSLGEARRDAKAPESELEPLAQRLNGLRERTAAAMQSTQPTREQCDSLARELAGERDTLQRLVSATRRAPAPVVLAAVPPPVVVTSPAAPQPQAQPQPQAPVAPPAPAYRSSLAPEPTPEQAAATMRTATVESSRPPDPRARACSGELRLSFRDVEQAITGLADGGSVAQQGKQMARRLLQMLLVQQVVIFSREYLSLEDCQQLAQTIADLRSQAQQLRATYAEARGQAQQQAGYAPQQQAFAPQPPRSDPRLDECRGHVRRGQSDLQQQFQGQQRTGRVSPQEFGEYQNIAGRLNQMMQAVFRDGASYADCQQTANFIGQAQGAVQRMAQVDPRIESCKVQVRQTYNDAQQQLQFAARSGRMTPQKAQALQMAQGRLSNLGSMAQRDFGSLMECQNVANALQQERGNIQGLAR